MPDVFKCPSCGAPLEVIPNAVTVKCPFCANTVAIPENMRMGVGIQKERAATAHSTVGLGDLLERAGDFGRLGQLVRSGNKLEAIRLYRELFGVGLKEAKDAVEVLGSGQAVTVTQVSGGAAQGEMDRQILALLQSGNKIGAIKLYRETYDTGLQEAKDAVEQIERNGVAGEAIPPGNSTTGQARSVRAGRWGVGIFFLVLLIFMIVPGVILFISLRPVLSVSQQVVSEIATRIPGNEEQPAVFPDLPLFTAVPTEEPSFAKIAMQFGGKGTGPGRFEDARSIGLDGDGNIYIGEYTGGRIQVFDPDGKFLTQWFVDREMPLRGMAVARDGTVWIVQRGEISRHNGMSGEPAGGVEWSGDWGFDDVALGPDGSAAAFWYHFSDDLVKFRQDGTVEFTVPGAISERTGDSELGGRVTMDGLGNLFLLGEFNEMIFQFDEQGNFTNRFGSVGDEPGQFRAPMAIAVDGLGRIYVSDFKGIQVFDPNGRYLDVIDVEGAVFGMVFNDRNELFVVSNTQEIFQFILQDE